MSFLKNILVLFALKVTFQNSVKISSPTENSNQIHTKYSTPTIQIGLIGKEVIKIETPIDSEYLSLDIKQGLCFASQKNVQFQVASVQSINNSITTQNLQGEIFMQKTISWTKIESNENSDLFTEGGLAILDSKFKLRMYQMQVQNQTYQLKLVKTVSLASYQFDFKILEDECEMIENNGIIFIFFENKIATYNIENNLFFTLLTLQNEQDIKNSQLYSYSNYVVLYIVTEKNTFLAYQYIQSDDQTKSKLLQLFKKSISSEVQDISINKIQLSGDSIEISVYLLTLEGIIKFKQQFQKDDKVISPILADEQFFIAHENGEFFTQYLGDVFIVIGNKENNHSVIEYQYISGKNQYYINYSYHFKEDLYGAVINPYYVILFGSTTHYFKWHSLHPSIIKNLQVSYQFDQQKFTLPGYFGSYVKEIKQNSSLLVGITQKKIFIAQMTLNGGSMNCGNVSHLEKNIKFNATYYVNCNEDQEDQTSDICQIQQEYLFYQSLVLADSTNLFKILFTIIFIGFLAFLIYIVSLFLYKKYAKLKEELIKQIQHLKKQHDTKIERQQSQSQQQQQLQTCPQQYFQIDEDQQENKMLEGGNDQEQQNKDVQNQ